MFTAAQQRNEVHIFGESQSHSDSRTESIQMKLEMSDLSTTVLTSLKCVEHEGRHCIDECQRFKRPREAEASKVDTHDSGKHGQRNSKNCGCGATNPTETKHLQSETLFNSNSSAKKNPDETLMKETRSLNEFYHDAMAAESGYGSLTTSTMSSFGILSPPIKNNTESLSMKSTCHACRYHTCSCHMGFQDFVDYDHSCSTSSSERQRQLDIVSHLKNHEPALMDKILSHLTAKDLVRFSGVNQEWRAICEGNKEAASKKSELLQQEQEERENYKENFPKQSCPRQTVGASTPLGVVQTLGKPQASSTPAPRSSSSKCDMFVKKAEFLLANESFTKCAKGSCTSPAKLTLHNQSAECVQCGYVFCTNCRGKYHRGSPCEALRCKNTAMKPNGISSRKSKNSLRRLSRLDSSS